MFTEDDVPKTARRYMETANAIRDQIDRLFNRPETIYEHKESEAKNMKKWEIVMSKDGLYIDAAEIIESESEPGYWICDEIAEKHGCDWWYVDEIEEE